MKQCTKQGGSPSRRSALPIRQGSVSVEGDSCTCAKTHNTCFNGGRKPWLFRRYVWSTATNQPWLFQENHGYFRKTMAILEIATNNQPTNVTTKRSGQTNLRHCFGWPLVSYVRPFLESQTSDFNEKPGWHHQVLPLVPQEPGSQGRVQTLGIQQQRTATTWIINVNPRCWSLGGQNHF